MELKLPYNKADKNFYYDKYRSDEDFVQELYENDISFNFPNLIVIDIGITI